MRLDPKGLEAARRAYQEEVSNMDMWHADGGPDDTPMDCAIRAYLEAAPSPSPAPGVVELHGPYGYLIKPIGLNEEHWYLSDDPSDRPDEEISVPLYAKEDQIAAPPQPAKGEREGGE